MVADVDLSSLLAIVLSGEEELLALSELEM